MRKLLMATCLALAAQHAMAGIWMIGDNDGYGAGIADNANHPFDGFNANYDGRSAAEALAINGAQYTDTYSTTHPGFSPQDGTIATFTFNGLSAGWTEGSMWFDMADFQASSFGAVFVTFNDIVQDWAFNDGFPATKVRFFDLSQEVLDSINLTGQLIVQIDRNSSGDFYGFDFALLSDQFGDRGIDLPEPESLLLASLGLLGIVASRRRVRQAA